jgi:glycosyltransferase involved in cell wall biosynthesis
VRVIHVTPYFAPAFRYGGPPRSIFGLCRALPDVGVDVEVFTTTANGPEPLPACPAGTEYEGVRVRYFPLAFPGRYWRAAGLGKALSAAAHAADLVHVHGLWNVPAWTGVRRARAAGVPYVISPRGMLQPAARAHHALSKAVALGVLERRHLRHAAVLHATSDEEAVALAPFGPPVITVPNGVSPIEVAPDDVARVRAAARVRPDAAVVLYLGRIHPIKRLDLLARAFVTLRATRDLRAVLVIAGPDEGRYRRAIEPHFAEASDAVRWVGPVAGVDKWAWLAGCDVLVQCSDSESFGMSVAEALAAGTPVVVTDRGPWRELQRQGCVRVAAHEPDALAATLADVLTGGAHVDAMAAQGRAVAARRFGWDRIALQMRDLYAQAVARPRKAA